MDMSEPAAAPARSAGAFTERVGHGRRGPFGKATVLFFTRNRDGANRLLLERLYEDVVAAVRRPAFYAVLGVPDTFEGRFDLLTLHAGLVLRRLNEAEPPGPAVAQDLVDLVFRHLDEGLREAGVGDLAVPKRMKKLAEAFLGRSASYAAALDAGDGSLAAALSRNIYAGADDGERLAAYVREGARMLRQTSLDDCLRRALPFPTLRV